MHSFRKADAVGPSLRLAAIFMFIFTKIFLKYKKMPTETFLRLIESWIDFAWTIWIYAVKWIKLMRKKKTMIVLLICNILLSAILHYEKNKYIYID